jgi:hypothetical protein
MSIMADPKLRKKTRRIYYGPPGNQDLFWTVKVQPATKAVTINGSLEHALAGMKGSTIGCHMSNCAMANERAFGHPVLLAVFTKKTCIIVTKIKDGVPSHGIEYYHDYNNLVMLNDRDNFKKYIKAHPELANRTFTLRPPSKAKQSRPNIGSDNPRGRGTITGEKRAYAPRGALSRAVDAGLINTAVAKVISKAHNGAADPNQPTLKSARRAIHQLFAAGT